MGSSYALKMLCIAAVAFIISGVQADMCAMGATEIDGNWFCQPVKAIQYSNVGRPGVYQQVVEMSADGTCKSQPKHFSGPIAPLDGEISLHFRGPLHLKQFAAYTPNTAAGALSKRKLDKLNARHSHQHNRAHGKSRAPAIDGEKNLERRQMVTATINGQVVSWMNNWFGPSSETTPAGAASPTQWVTATIDGQIVSWVNNWPGSPPTAQPTPSAPTAMVQAAAVGQSPKVPDAAAATHVPTAAVNSVSDHAAIAGQNPPVGPNFHGDAVFERISYYHAESQTADNIAFLGNFGGQGSGVFDFHFGASASYVNCNGTAGAASPQILADTMIPSDAEVVVMLGEECKNGDCGYVRPGAVAHHGFAGADKAFLMEFIMPMDGKTGFNGDMPAIWSMNAEIFRTVQYGPADCSCWTSGCGEFDIVEALYDGSDKLKSTLHTNTPGGDSDYIVRPTSTSMKLAVVFSSATSTINIQVLADSMDFAPSLSAKDMNSICTTEADNLISHFAVVG